MEHYHIQRGAEMGNRLYHVAVDVPLRHFLVQGIGATFDIRPMIRQT